MKKWLRYSFIVITSFLLVSSIGYASFLVYKVSNSDSDIIDNTYDIIFHFRDFNDVQSEKTITFTDLEEDSYFDLPYLSYDTLTFSGWSPYVSRNPTISQDIHSISIKYIKETYTDVTFTDNTLHLYALINSIDQNHCLLNITDQTGDSPTPNTYHLLTKAENFSLFNISYVYPSTFISVTIEGQTKGINDTFDLSPYGGTTVDVLVNKL